MADELTLRASLSFEKGNTTLSLALGPTKFDVSGTNGIHHRQGIGTDEEAVVVGDVAAGGYVLLVNRDDTNFVELRPGSGAADLVRLEPGDFALFRLADDATLYAVADTAAVELEVLAIDA